MPQGQLHRADDVFVEELDGQLLLLKTGSPDVVHLDAVASDAWRLLEEPASREQLAELLAVAYSVEPAQVADDLTPLLELLLSHGLVSEGPSS